MGTDIHTAAEWWDGSRWRFAGKVFDSPYDWAWEPCTRENLEGLSDGKLIDALEDEIKKGEGESEWAKHIELAVEDFEHRRKLMNEKIDEAREASRARGWNYYKDVEPVERRLRKALYDGTALLHGAREHLIEQALEYNELRLLEVMTEEKFSREEAEHYGGGLTLHYQLAEGDPPLKTVEPFGERNYDLFAALAGVRNGTGFAGIRTGDPLVPIAEPRGVPHDADPETLKWLSDEHTPSWLTLAELKAYDWDQPKHHAGVVDKELYLCMKSLLIGNPWDEQVGELMRLRYKRAPSVCGSIGGSGVVEVTAAQYLRSSPSAQAKATHISIEWTTPLRDSIGQRFFDSWDELEKLIPEPHGDYDDVRVVFDFDS